MLCIVNFHTKITIQKCNNFCYTYCESLLNVCKFMQNFTPLKRIETKCAINFVDFHNRSFILAVQKLDRLADRPNDRPPKSWPATVDTVTVSENFGRLSVACTDPNTI
ncbi:hypothetical protein BpHYR1_023459 [Brachionus plicatilis]|uniref:Uncharacterized protein n=1 Tax=Brachionus plicatilis TaxID=10195 RepID=A0A3M7T0Z8_BRAPC|nr:hypothetical protein BpHYR1_023459 [Brachionus plicatilis]